MQKWHGPVSMAMGGGLEKLFPPPGCALGRMQASPSCSVLTPWDPWDRVGGLSHRVGAASLLTLKGRRQGRLDMAVAASEMSPERPCVEVERLLLRQGLTAPRKGAGPT